MSASELAEHASYLGDTVKLAAYEQALRAHLSGGTQSVLDLGAGTGILGLLAARADARIVYAVDSGAVIAPATQVAAASPYADQIVHLRGRSTEIELPELVDVAVCDQIGGFVHDAGVLEYFADARRRLLTDDGVLVPSRFRLFVSPAECPTIREQIDLWGSLPVGIDFSVFRESAVNSEHTIDGDQARLLAHGTQIAEIAADHTTRILGGGTAMVSDTGRCDGLVGWFEADLGGGATLTNQPDHPGRMRRWCTYYPLGQGIEVQPGDAIEMNVDVRPLLHTVTWRVAITAPNGELRARERHSTLLGRFLADDEIARAGGAPVAATPAGRAVARLLNLADGTRSTDELIAQLQAENLVEGDDSSLALTLRNMLERFATPRVLVEPDVV